MTQDEFRAQDAKYHAWQAVKDGRITEMEFKALGWKPYDWPYQHVSDLGQRWLRDDPDGQAHYARFKVRLAAEHAESMAMLEARQEANRQLAYRGIEDSEA
jgi:GrpB-like predicted nucleotidyltransferase (UPF0157 family)